MNEPALIVALTSALLLVTSGAAIATPSPASNPVVARADGATLRRSDVEALLGRLDDATRVRVQADPKLIAALVKQELARRAVLKMAEQKNWERRPDVLAQIERSRQEVVVTSYLKDATAPPADFPSATEIEQAYKLQQSKFIQPRQYHLAQIFLRVTDGSADSVASKAVQSRAQSLFDTLRKSPDRFAEFAKQSDDPSGTSGGDLGWLAENQLENDIRAAVAALGQGEVSAPLFATGGWHLIRLIETRPARVKTLDEVRPQIVEMLRQARAHDNAEQLVNRLLADEHAGLDGDAIATFVRH